MTQEEKQLLLKDLCARLPYEPKLCIDGGVCSLLNIDKEEGDRLNGETFYTIGFKNQDGLYNFCALSEARPYLRPLSSMTKEEEHETNTFGWMLYRLGNKSYISSEDMNDPLDYGGFRPISIQNDTLAQMADWLYEHHFDFRGLIPEGLAIEAPEGMYKTE